MPLQTPLIITGTITATDRPLGGITLNITNSTTNEVIQVVTGEKGEYVGDAGNFALVGDEVVVTAHFFPTHDANITTENGRIELT